MSMATYAELNAIMTDTVAGAQVLREKVGVACLIAAETIISGNDDTDPPWDQTAGMHTQRLKWADHLLSGFERTTRELFGIVIAANESATQTQILQASDSAIQSNVNASIDALAANL